jgi:hypothetical protein
VHNALAGQTTDETRPHAIPEKKFYKSNQFKNYLAEMKIESQAPYEPPTTTPRK